MTESAAPPPASRELPTRAQTLMFGLKAWGLRMQRALHDAGDGARPVRHAPAEDLRAAPLLTEFDSALWPCEEADVSLVAGKLQNLRMALRHLDGVEVPANATFSFWKQTGRATRRRGYVVGRELREGCLIPAIGGGLCQLSNAVYDCALRAGLEIVERHRHSRALPGSLAELDRDATVFWNYVDLRLRAPFAWRLEVRMDARHLRVRIRGLLPAGAASAPRLPALRSAQPTNDCASCGQVRCHLHTGPSRTPLRQAWGMQAAWPEFKTHLQQCGAETGALAPRVCDAGPSPLLPRALQAARWRWGRWRGEALPKLRLIQMERGAREFARRLNAHDIDLVLPQSLLPFLWRAGELAGRRYTVMMSAQPMATLQAQLDRAAALHPQVRSLRDFRADPALVEAEWQALQAAAAWASPHARILEEAGARAHALPWCLPPAVERATSRPAGPPRIFFAASALARKGIFEFLSVLRDEAVDVLLPPGERESGLDAGRANLRRVDSYREGVREADLVVLPAWVEHQPRALLSAIASGVPVIATPACGLGAQLPWIGVEAGDAQGLRAAMQPFLARTMA